MQPDAREAFRRLRTALEAQVSFSPAQQAAVDLVEGPARHTCLVGGTRSGKTFILVRHVAGRALAFPGSRHAVLRFRANAARSSVALDTLPAVLRKCYPDARVEERRNDGFFQFDNGSQIWIGGLDDKDRVEKILGQEYATILLNEASQIPYASALVALTRLAQTVPGCRQKLLVDLNPGPKSHWTNQLFGEHRDPVTRQPLPNPDDYTRAFLNPRDNRAHLSPEYLAALAAMPLRQRQRFYEGVYVEDAEGALWRQDLIEANRVAADRLPAMSRVVVAIDPAVSSSETSDETGLVVAGRGTDGHGYLLEDASGKHTPTEWARKAVALYHRWRADRIVAEVNQGGAMVEATVRAVDPNAAFKGVHASRGKVTRAEPISALAERGRIHHVGAVYPELEEQLTGYAPGSTKSPDRLDAYVWAFTELLDVADGTGIIEFYRQEAERAAAGAPDPAAGHGWTMPGMGGGPAPGVRLRVPEGHTVTTLSGAPVVVEADGTALFAEADSVPLRQLGWEIVAAEAGRTVTDDVQAGSGDA
ncbi:phage terminase large subunit [Methylobacterium terricola]|uniref:phage terminase large subunit n=1 Tax=Methylobacterium terricola TaxID=2583531 RepID=UPI001FE33146|nr:phage terminase large subunit [Methylobacterium terricola]